MNPEDSKTNEIESTTSDDKEKKEYIGKILDMIRDETGLQYHQISDKLYDQCIEMGITKWGPKNKPLAKTAKTRIWEWCKGVREVPEWLVPVIVNWGLKLFLEESDSRERERKLKLMRTIVMKCMIHSCGLNWSMLKSLNINEQNILKLVNEKS